MHEGVMKCFDCLIITNCFVEKLQILVQRKPIPVKAKGNAFAE